MIEARIFTDSLDDARSRLAALGGENQGRYVINDEIYRNVDETVSLADEFLRLRVVPENIWDEKPVILALKQTKLRSLGKDSQIPLKLQFDTKEEAKAYYDQHLKDEYVFDFSFSRVGWQYFLPNSDVVDLEILEDKYPSIEFKSKTDEGMKRLLGMFAVNEGDVVRGPSVVAFKPVLQR
jgi:hypothetical protein